MPNWNPDPRWPTRIVQLAEAIADGNDCRFALHDAFLDLGLKECANDCKHDDLGITNAHFGWCGYFVGLILNDGWSNFWQRNTPAKREAANYLEGRQPCSTDSSGTLADGGT